MNQDAEVKLEIINFQTAGRRRHTTNYLTWGLEKWPAGLNLLGEMLSVSSVPGHAMKMFLLTRYGSTLQFLLLLFFGLLSGSTQAGAHSGEGGCQLPLRSTEGVCTPCS